MIHLHKLNHQFENLEAEYNELEEEYKELNVWYKRFFTIVCRTYILKKQISLLKKLKEVNTERQVVIKIYQQVLDLLHYQFTVIRNGNEVLYITNHNNSHISLAVVRAEHTKIYNTLENIIEILFEALKGNRK